MTSITSESPDGKRRIIIDLSSKTVCFIECHIPSEQKWFSLHPRRHTEFICPFADILAVYTLRDVRHNRALVLPRVDTVQIATTSGNGVFTAEWPNWDEVKRVLTEISRTTPDPPALRNPNIAIIPFLIGCFVVAASIIALYFWLTGS